MLREGNEVDNVPVYYQIYRWRKKMKVSYLEAMCTPYSVIITDLQIMNYEQLYLYKQDQQQ